MSAGTAPGRREGKRTLIRLVRAIDRIMDENLLQACATARLQVNTLEFCCPASHNKTALNYLPVINTTRIPKMQKRFYRINVVEGTSYHDRFSKHNPCAVARPAGTGWPHFGFRQNKEGRPCYDNASHSPYSSSSRLFRAAWRSPASAPLCESSKNPGAFISTSKRASSASVREISASTAVNSF